MSSKPSASGNAGRRGVHQSGGERGLEESDLIKLPAHVESVREGLLDFDRFLGLEAAIIAAGENDEDNIPLSAYKPDGATESQRAKEREFVECAQNLVKGARNAQTREEWHILIRKWVIERLDSVRNAGYVTQSSKFYSSITWAENQVWSNSSDRQNHQPAKPSLYFGFPIPKTSQNPTRGFRKDSSFGNYTVPYLSQLSTHGLQCVPVVGHLAQEPGLKHRLICFPWAIVQIFGTFPWDKPNDASFVDLIPEGSAAASTALSLFETLARFPDEKHDGQHIPPVVVITSAGAETTVWLAYCEIVNDRLRDHKMISIWEGDITKIWDAIQICRIIDNLFFWAQHCLKPMVTKYLDQWGLRYCPKVPNMHFQLEKDTEIAELVHRIQDRLSSLGISPNENLPALVRQAVVFQEVMGSSSKAVQADSISKEENDHSTTAKIFSSHPKGSPLKVSPSGSKNPGETPELSPLLEEKRIQEHDDVSDYEPDTSDISPKEAVLVEQQLARNRIEDSNATLKDIEYDDSQTKNDDGVKAESPVLHKDYIFQPKAPPEHENTVIAALDKGKESVRHSSKAPEGTKATSTYTTSDKPVSISESPILSGADGTTKSSASLSNSPQAPQGRTADFETRKSSSLGPSKDSDDASLNIIQRTLHDMASRVVDGHVLSLEKQRRQKLDRVLEEKKKLNTYPPPAHGGSVSRNSSQSAPPNPFVSETFKLSFKVTPWLDLDMREREGSTMGVIHRHGPYPTLHIWMVEHVSYPRRSVTHIGDLQKRVMLQHQPAFMEPTRQPPPFMVKIPYRGKNIIVKLPPVNPESWSTKRKNESPGKVN